MRGWLAGLCLLCCVAARADEPDAATADALRWADPRGSASGARRSTALPVTGDLAQAWEVRLPYRVAAPPVHWEGRVYLLCRQGEASYLVGVDLFRGTVLAKKRLGKGPVSPPVVWDHRVVLKTKPDAYSEYKLVGKTFNRVWQHRPDAGALSDPVVFENEIYAVAQGTVIKLRPGRAKPVWSRPGVYRGRPAVFGGHLYVLFDGTVPGYHESLHIAVLDRRTGEPVGQSNVAWYKGKEPPPLDVPGEITVTPDRVYVRAPAALATQGGSVRYASVARNRKGVPVGDPVHLHAFAAAPAVHADGVLALHKERGQRWLLFSGDKRWILAESKLQGDLFRHPFPATLLGDIAYFGDWAADIKTLEVLWRLPVRQPRFPVVPADRMILVVDGPATLRAYRERR